MVASYLIAAALPLAAALVADVRAPLSVQGRFRAPSMVANPPASTDALNAPSTDVDSDSSSNGGLFNTLQMLRPRRQEPGDAEEVEEPPKATGSSSRSTACPSRPPGRAATSSSCRRAVS